MPETPYTGLTAAIKIGTGASAKTIAYISGFKLSLSKDIIEIISFGSTYKEKVPSIKDWSASMDGTVALSSDGTQKELLDAFESGDSLTFGMYLNDSTYFEGTGYVSGIDIDASADDAISLSGDVAGSGAIVTHFTTSGT